MLKVCKTLYNKQKLIPEEKLVPRYCAYAIIIRRDNILLISTKRTNKFWFPGGVIEKNESDQQALVREVHEETGLEVVEASLFTEVESYFYYDPQAIAFRQYSKFYVCTVKNGEISDQVNTDTEDEAEKPQWLNILSLDKDSFQDYGFEIFSLVQILH